MIRTIGLLGLACLLIFCWPRPVVAENSDQLAVTCILDNSGSMKNNDPNKLRFSAVGMLVDLMRSGDKVGLISFSTTAKTVVSLSGLDSLEQRSAIKATLAATENGEDWTDLAAGLETAFAELEKTQGQGVAILVSDGEPEPGPGFRTDAAWQKEYLQRVWTTVNRFSSRGWPIYCIGLSNQADISLLQKISQETGGTMFRAAEASSLAEIFQDILGGFRDTIPLGEFTTPMSLEQWSEPNLIRVNSSLKLLTVRGLSTEGKGMNLQLKDPMGKILQEGSPGIAIVHGSNYCSVSVDNPAPGNWLVQAEGGGNGRINVQGQSQYVLQVLDPVARGTMPILCPAKFRVKVWENGLAAQEQGLKLSLQRDEQNVLTLNPDPQEPGLYSGELKGFLSALGPQRFKLKLEDSAGEIVGKELFYYGIDTPYLSLGSSKLGWLGEKNLLQAQVMYRDKVLTGGNFKILAKVSGPNQGWEVTLKDDGSSGDSIARDGSYGTWFTPPSTGNYIYSLQLIGDFQGRAINYELSDLSLTVGVRPQIDLTLPQGASVGRDGILQVQVESKAATFEQLTLSGTVGGWVIPPQTVTLPAGDKRVINLQVPWQQGDTAEVAELKLSGPNLKEQIKPIMLFFRTPWQDIWYSHRVSLLIGIIVVGLLGGVIGFGSLLFHHFQSRVKLKGMLVLGPVGRYTGSRRLVPLHSFNKANLTLGWSQDADILLESDSETDLSECSLEVAAMLEAKGLNFLAGWQCLFGRNKPITVLRSLGSAFRLKDKGSKRFVATNRTILQDGDEVTFHGCRLLYRR